MVFLQNVGSRIPTLRRLEGAFLRKLTQRNPAPWRECDVITWLFVTSPFNQAQPKPKYVSYNVIDLPIQSRQIKEKWIHHDCITTSRKRRRVILIFAYVPHSACAIVFSEFFHGACPSWWDELWWQRNPEYRGLLMFCLPGYMTKENYGYRPNKLCVMLASFELIAKIGIPIKSSGWNAGININRTTKHKVPSLLCES